MLRSLSVIVAMCVVTACSLPDTPPVNKLDPQGVVVGFVRDSAGHGVSNTVVCATASFDRSGTPAIVSSDGFTNTDGSYVVPMYVTVDADARANLTVAATPGGASGLGAVLKSGLTILLAATPPPAETTRVDLVVPAGSPPSSVLCALGP